MLTANSLKLRLTQLFSQSLLVGGLTAISLLSGFIPELSEDSYTLVIRTSAYAQDVTSEISPNDVTQYAEVLLQIEPIRASAYEKITTILGEQPEIFCDDSDSISKLPSTAQEIAKDYCQQSEGIVSKYFPEGGNKRFNEITIEMQDNQNLREQIQSELVRIQQAKFDASF